MGLWQWSTTPANNASAGAIDWAEGQPPSTVNDSARQMMADVAVQFQNGWEWQSFGDTPTYVSSTQFTVPGNLTSRYSVGRRVRAAVTAGTVYGTITTSAFTSLTTVTLTIDSGALDSGLSQVDVGILNPLFSSFPSNFPGNFSTLSSTGLYSATNTAAGASIIKLTGNGSTTPTKYLGVLNGLLTVYSNSGGAQLLSLDDSGNLTATGNVTSASDRRLKTDVETIGNALARVRKLNGVTYRRKDIDQGIRQTGLIAQDVRHAMPEAVREGPDGHLSVAYGNLVGLLVEAVKELADQVSALKASQ